MRARKTASSIIGHVLARLRRDQRGIGDRDRGVRPALAVTISRRFDFFKVVGGHWKVILGHDRSHRSSTEPATFSFGQAGPLSKIGKDRYRSSNGEPYAGANDANRATFARLANGAISGLSFLTRTFR